MFVKKNFLVIVILLAVVFAVAMKATVFQKPPTPAATSAPAASAEFRKYWLSGETESTSYTLMQIQGGVLKAGQATLAFDVEDFRTDKQVRATSEAGRDKSIPVLKTSLVYAFGSDVLLCSRYTTVFTPMPTGNDQPPIFPNTLKLTSATQEKAGTAYTQLNLRTNGYQVLSHSYTEEGDDDYRIDKVLLEDELYNRIRLNPAKLPTGAVQLIPGAITARLQHKKMEPQSATVGLGTITAQAWFGDSARTVTPIDSLQTYSIDYSGAARTLMIVFDRAFPFQIMGWKETYTDAGKTVITKATLVKTLRNANQ